MAVHRLARDYGRSAGSIVADLGGAAFYAWATLLYTIASIISTVCGGLVTARLDLRRGYLVGHWS